MGNIRSFKHRFKPDVYAKLLKNGAYNGEYHMSNSQFRNPEELVSSLFIWSQTPEGTMYWAAISERFRLRDLARRARRGNKTMINHLMSLPRKYRRLAIRNFINLGDPNIKFSRKEKYPTTALISAFVWDSSPEGFNFWDAAYTEVFQSISRNFKVKK